MWTEKNDQELRAAYAALGIKFGIDVADPDSDSISNKTFDNKCFMTLTELRKPFVVLVQRDGCPGYSWIVAGDSLEDVKSRCPKPRSGPNGPIDCIKLLRPFT